MKTKITFLNRFETAVFILFVLLFTSINALSQALVTEEPTAHVATDFSGSVFFSTKHDPFLADDVIPVNPKSPDGVYYMVQVGAYQNPITADLYPSYGPFVSHELANGMTRYLVGYFRDYQEAVASRNEMVKSPGYEKSFVVAYHQNNSVALGYAWRVQKRDGLVAHDVAAASTAKEQPKNMTVPEEMIEMPGLRYYVHLGEFKEEVPQRFANAIILASEHAMITETSRGESTVFHTETVSTLMTAIQLSDFLASEGIHSTHIVAVFEGIEISLVDAAKIRNGEMLDLKAAAINIESPIHSTAISMHQDNPSDEELDALLKRAGR